MTADELIAELEKADKGQHLDVLILADAPAHEGDDCADYEVAVGLYSANDEIPMKQVIYIQALVWRE